MLYPKSTLGLSRKKKSFDELFLSFEQREIFWESSVPVTILKALSSYSKFPSRSIIRKIGAEVEVGEASKIELVPPPKTSFDVPIMAEQVKKVSPSEAPTTKGVGFELQESDFDC